MKVKSESKVAQSCPTLRDPMDCSLPGSSILGIFQARVLEWGAITFTEQVAKSVRMDKIAQREESSLGAQIISLGSPDIQGESRERREVQKTHNEQQGREKEIQWRPEEGQVCSVQTRYESMEICWLIWIQETSGDLRS